MRRLFLFLSVVLLIGIIHIVTLNFNSPVAVKYLYSALLDAQTQAGWTEQGAYFVQNMSLSIYTIIILISGIFIGAGIVYMFLSIQKDKLKAYKRELEKTSISGMNNASRVEVLEAKIKTLEKAFNTVIDERTQLEVQIKSLNAELDKINKNR